MPPARQLRLLLWKDFLIRKRNLITLGGVVWATAVALSLYAVRANVGNVDRPTCQYAARALPSAGVVTFLQSFICSVDNECRPLDQYEEIPTYENSTLTKLQRRFAPLVYNESVLGAAAAVPDGLRLLAALAGVLDEPTFLEITENGLKVQELFVHPARVRRYIAAEFNVTLEAADSVMRAELDFQGIVNGDIDRCSASSVQRALRLADGEHLHQLVARLCSLAPADIRRILLGLVGELNFDKYFNMIGVMYEKLSGDDGVVVLGRMLTAVLRMRSLRSFLPPELAGWRGEEGGFSYFNLTLLPKIMDQFKPIFGGTQSYKTLREVIDAAVVGVQYLNQLLSGAESGAVEDAASLVLARVGGARDFAAVSRELNATFDGLPEGMDPFNVFSKLTTLVHKWLPDDVKHTVLLYSTLLAKLIEGAHKVVLTNRNIEEVAYNASLRNPEGFKILLEIPVAMVGRGLDGLADAERAQIFTSKIQFPGQLFCDKGKLQRLFLASGAEADLLKARLCGDAWKNYFHDVIRSFGYYDVEKNINDMASLLIQETLGKDTSSQLYTIDKDFQILKEFYNTLVNLKPAERTEVDWEKLLNVSKDSEFMKMFEKKVSFSKQILITLHGALAKEIIKQNSILEYKMTPILLDASAMVAAVNRQLAATPGAVTDRMKNMYPDVLRTVLLTALDEEKTYKSLSTHSEDMFCRGVEAAAPYIAMPPAADAEQLLTALCNMSAAIEAGLRRDSFIGKAAEAIRNSSRGREEVNWTRLIDGVKRLHAALEADYTYLFEFRHFGMDAHAQAETGDLFDKAREFWFGKDTWQRSLHLSIKLGFRVLDVLDREIFNLTGEGWRRARSGLDLAAGPLAVAQELVGVITAVSRNESYATDLPPGTARALRRVLPRLPRLLADAADALARDDADIASINSIFNGSPAWPCASLASVLELTDSSREAVGTLETALCLEPALRREWREYLAERNMTSLNWQTWNSSSAHVFLRFSSTFDSVVRAAAALKKVLAEIADDSSSVSERPMTLAAAWRHARCALEGKEHAVRNFFTKLDIVLDSISTPAAFDSRSLHSLWEELTRCSAGPHTADGPHDDECKELSRAAWKNTLRFVSVLVSSMSGDLYTYFSEVSEPNANLLQMLGFTRSTGLYMLYDNIGEFLAVLFNSYLDLGFMNQIRRASQSQFWDCSAVVGALAPPPGSGVDGARLRRVQPYLCPELLHWVSLPRGDNVLLDVFANPQYFFFASNVSDLSSSYQRAFDTVTNMTALLKSISSNNDTAVAGDDLDVNTITSKLENVISTILNYNLNSTDVAYKHFNDMNSKQFAATAYLARIVAIVNKIREAIDNLNVNEFGLSEDETKNLEADLITIQKMFKKRPTEAIALHFDVITNIVWQNEDAYYLTGGITAMCDDLKNNDTKIDILVDTERTKALLCSKNYQTIYGAVESSYKEDLENTRQSLFNVVDILQRDVLYNITDVAEFLRERIQIVNYLKHSIKYAYELGLPLYLRYLRDGLRHQRVVAGFLAGGDWWRDLRNLYDGPIATKFLDSLENSFEIAKDVLTNLDQIHLVRLLRDVDLNDTAALCRPDLALADYIPDHTGAFSELRSQLCAADQTELFKELPMLVLASQGYNEELKLSSEIDYPALNADIAGVERALGALRAGPRAPRRPAWASADRLAELKLLAMDLFSKETITKVAFGVLTNIVDASTLFLNSSECAVCSPLTSWFKQLNLQLFKKQEYDALLCRLHELPEREVHQTLKNDFHWDMAIQELMSTRNYTKLELNRAVTDFLEHVQLHLLEELRARGAAPRLADCLAGDVGRNALGNATLFLKVVSHTLKLVRSQLPHLKEIEGVSEAPLVTRLFAAVTRRLDAHAPLAQMLNDHDHIREEVKQIAQIDVKDIVVNLRTITRCKDLSTCVKFTNNDVYDDVDGSKIIELINNNLNKTLIEIELPRLQAEEFWRFSFISNILSHVEQLLASAARLLGVASRVGAEDLLRGQPAAALDFLMRLLAEDNLETVVYSLQSIISELRPVLEESPFEDDVGFLGKGLKVLQRLKNYLLEQDLKVQVSELFSSPERVEAGLSALGINNTNFWSVAAPRIHAGQLDLKPVLTSSPSYRARDFVCQPAAMARVLLPAAGAAGVSADDVRAAVADQLCGAPPARAAPALAVLLENINFTYVGSRMSSVLVSQLYGAANLSAARGAAAVAGGARVAALLPLAQAGAGALADTLAADPLLQDLANSTSLRDLLASSSFMSSAGRMVCGAPMRGVDARYLKVISQASDFATQPDPAQLAELPTEFCRSLYTDIVGVPGGKIVWSYVKPLLMGRVLYTPASPAVERIIRQANSSYAHLGRLAGLVHSFAAAMPAADQLAAHRAGLAALRRLAAAPALRDLVGAADLPSFDADALFDERPELKNIGNLLKKGSDLLRCLNMDRFHPVASEYQLTHDAVRLTRVNEFSAGLVFSKVVEREGRPLDVEYTIRMDIESVPTTTRIRNQFWTPGPEDSFLENMRYFRGFVQLQDLVDNAIITLAGSSSSSNSSDSSNSSSSVRVRRDAESRPQKDKWAVYTQQTPYPCYRNDYFQASLYESQALVVVFFFALLYSVASATRFLVAEKESGNRMLMSVMGVNLSCHTLSWFIASWVELALAAACMTAVLAAGALPRTDVSLLFALVCVFGTSALAFCYMVSKLFSSASSAAVSAALAYLVTFMPFVLILSLEALLSPASRILACLSMSTAFSYALLFVARAEAVGAGARWATLWAAADDGMSVGLAMLMMLADAALYLAAGSLLERFYGTAAVGSHVAHAQSADEGVSVLNVSKTYGARAHTRKVALDNVSIELRKGQITTLLGHNGAGKTTLINILTGMLKPTSGHVTVRSPSPRRARLGVCPQRDVLLPELSAREHVTLHARLAARPLAEVQSMLDVVSLGAHAEVPARQLSGGTRRRLCVALAFVGQPGLVTLDEPAAGVDPAARRDIWAMILRLKEERTVLLTTHHLDEAEFLSDQLVILHQGQVHTMGSPIEIKRSLGNGYKLTVTYPLDGWGEGEEKTKALLGAVRGAVGNAELADADADAEADADAGEVEITLPFFDADGLHNNFQKVCEVLEARQQELGFSSFTMDCSSLEQVFHGVTAPPAYGVGSSDSGEAPSKSVSTASIKTERAPLVDAEGALTGTRSQQFLALLRARYLHYVRNRWLLFILLVLPALFVTVAMAFSLVRPPADNELPLRLHPALYAPATQFLVPHPTIYSGDVDPSFAQNVMDTIRHEHEGVRNWTTQDSPECRCDIMQVCNMSQVPAAPPLLLLPDAATLNDWLITSQEAYVERRYGGYSSAVKHNRTALVAWYNNKGHHALPSFLNGLHAAALRSVAGAAANITTYTHPLKISKEQLSKSTLLQHVADAGISGMILIAYSLVSAGAALYLVQARSSQQKRLQLLSGVSPALYWAAALAADMAIIVINIVISVVVLEAFGFPVFVARNNLPAICLLLLLFGYSCGSLVHLAEKLFTDASLANMVLFCGNVFCGLAGITTLLVLDIISESQAADDARWLLHKIFLLSPQFVLGDGLLEVAKNTIQAQVLERFGMDTYKDPLASELLTLHYAAALLVGTALLLLNLALEYDCLAGALARFGRRPPPASGAPEPASVAAERRRVSTARGARHGLPTIGNINAGFIDTEGKRDSARRMESGADVAQCVELTKVYRGVAGDRVAVRGLTLGIPPGQCTALLGENGAGKSTTFAMLSGELRPSAGHVRLDDEPADARRLRSGLISYCPQSNALDPLLAVTETLGLYCRLRGIQQEHQVIKRTLDMFELARYGGARAGALSGGNQRKLCAAIAFMGRAPLVLLDEPTSGMDPFARACVWRGARAARAARRGVLLSTHALRDARRLAARVALMRAGQLCALQTVDDCLTSFGGGYCVCCRVGPAPGTAGAARAVWRRVLAAAPRARLRDLRAGRLHFLLPHQADEKGGAMRLSAIFRLMAELQSECDVEDFTINQSSLEEMFQSFSDKPQDLEPSPSPPARRASPQLNSVTSL